MNDKTKYIIYKFAKFAESELGIQKEYTLFLDTDRNDKYTTFAYYSPKDANIGVYIKNRAIPDVCRSLGHELVHHSQFEKNMIKGPIQDVGGPEENEANAKAGEIIKKFGYANPDIGFWDEDVS